VTAEQMPEVLVAADMAPLFRETSARGLEEKLRRGTWQGPRPCASRPYRWTKRAVLDWLRKH
jgi:hypothetical protein